MSQPVHSYRDLLVWQRVINLTEQVYALSQSFPKEEQFVLTAQHRRAVLSVPSNIAEGWGRRSRREYVQFLYTARGSLIEVETQLIIAARLGYANADEVKTVLGETERLGRMLFALIRSLRKTPHTP